MLRFEIHDAGGHQRHFWRVVDGADILARSETMFNKADCMDAARKVKYSTDTVKFESFQGTAGQWSMALPLVHDGL